MQCIIPLVDDEESFVVFPPIRFLEKNGGEFERAMSICTKEEFEIMIRRWLPLGKIRFGNVYEGYPERETIFSMR